MSAIDLISGLIYRQKASAGQSILSGKLAGWAATSGAVAVNTVQATVAHQPATDLLNGLTVAKFADSSDYLEDAALPVLTGLTGWSCWLVCYVASNGIVTFQPFRGNPTGGAGPTSHQLSSQYVNVGNADYGAYGTTTGWHIVSVVYDGTLAGNANRLKVYLDMQPVTLAFTGTIPAAQPATLGARIGWPTLSGVGDMVADSGFVNRAITNAELLDVNKDLAVTYNLPLAGYLVQPEPGIPSVETFGVGSLSVGMTSPAGIPSAEAFGVGSLSVELSSPAGIPSAEAFGVGSIAVELVSPAGIPSAEAFGVGEMTIELVSPDGIPSAEAFGVGSIAGVDVTLIQLAGIPSAEAFGVGIIGGYDMATVTVRFPYIDGLTGRAEVALDFPADGIITLGAGGVAAVPDDRVTALSRITLTPQDGGAVPSGVLYVAARTPGVGFTIASTNVGDAGVVVYYQLWEAST